MFVKIPNGQYLKKVEATSLGVNIDFASPKKVALVFICLNDHYWPYLSQVVKDCKKHFLPQHQVDYFAWTDYNEVSKKKVLDHLDGLLAAYQASTPEKKQEALGTMVGVFAQMVRLYEHFFIDQITALVTGLQQQGIVFRRDASRYWVEAMRPLTDADAIAFHAACRHIMTHSFADMDATLQGAHLIDTEAVQWPAPTLMRYHLFLNEEERLKDYDYIFYMDADMKVVSIVGDEVLGEGLTAAEHPMYSLRSQYIPPYEPNKLSAAYINRPGKVITDEMGKPRFKPYYYAGGFQGGTSKDFIKAMRVMKKSIDTDFDKINYTAIWNDESHWNKYLSENEPDIVLSPSYIYPDSLIKEYYEPLWGRSYEPKIITLTKPFSLSAQGAQDINKFIQGK